MELFRCEPYRLRLTPQACAQQFRDAKEGKSSSPQHHRLSVGCEVGAAHAAGETPVATAEVHAPPAGGEEQAMAKHAKRECPCGKTYTPKGPAQRHCSPKCPERPTAVRSGSKPPRKVLEPRDCDQCGDSFTPTRKDQRFCPGGVCRAKFNARNKAKGKEAEVTASADSTTWTESPQSPAPGDAPAAPGTTEPAPDSANLAPALGVTPPTTVGKVHEIPSAASVAELLELAGYKGVRAVQVPRGLMILGVRAVQVPRGLMILFEEGR